MSRPICTLIHLSDLHFGSQFVIDGETWWRKFVTSVPFLRHVTGYFPHGYQTAGALAIAVRTILRHCKDTKTPVLVVHTGDLTASGAQAEFSVGETFLRSGHFLENKELCGLNLDSEFGWFSLDIPGNHDLWRRRSPKANNAASSHYGGAYPREFQIPSANPPVHIYGIDSNRSSLWQHRLANGEIPTSALNSLLEKLRVGRTTGAIQVVCLHHPLQVLRQTAPRLCGIEILKLRRRQEIARSLSNAGAHIVLAGHIHNQQYFGRTPISPLHFIAGSACQIGSPPSFWRLELFQNHAEYTYLHIPKGRFHFEPASSRSGQASY